MDPLMWQCVWTLITHGWRQNLRPETDKQINLAKKREEKERLCNDLLVDEEIDSDCHKFRPILLVPFKEQNRNLVKVAISWKMNYKPFCQLLVWLLKARPNDCNILQQRWIPTLLYEVAKWMQHLDSKIWD